MESDVEIRHRIGMKVKAARQAAALSRRSLAAHANVSERYLNQLEAGTGRLTVQA
jgi:transcriptional regulator with XRE-family HTH domain